MSGRLTFTCVGEHWARPNPCPTKPVDQLLRLQFLATPVAESCGIVGNGHSLSTQ